MRVEVVEDGGIDGFQFIKNKPEFFQGTKKTAYKQEIFLKIFGIR